MKTTILFFCVGICAGCIATYDLVQTCAARSRVLVNDRNSVSAGYVLVAPYTSGLLYDKPGEVYLIDKDGRIVHTWKTKYPVLIAYLEPSGHIYAAMTPPINPANYPSGGTTGLLQEIDWDGKVIWEYSDSDMTHDFEVMSNGNIAYIRWHKTPASYAAKVVGGHRTQATDVWSNEIVEINRDKKTLWTWRPEEHLSAGEYVLDSQIPRNDFSHINSVRYTENSPLTHTPAFLISARHLNTVFIVDAKTGDIVWRSPKGLTMMQHDATFLENGNILLFDNGYLRSSQLPALMSRVLEIDPKTNDIVWKYPDGTSPIESFLFADSLMSGAQRLANGNTLITESVKSTILEVTPDQKIVWRYDDEFFKDTKPLTIFKTRKYSAEGTEWGRQLSRFPTSLFFCKN